MAFQIKGIDLNPNAGDSWMGLTREQSKFIASILILTGLFFADPPFSVIPSDIFNIWLAGGISQQFHISFEFAILLTYTVVAWGLILAGIWIYPYDSRRLLSGLINKFKRLITTALRKPIYLVTGLTIFMLMFLWYKRELASSGAKLAEIAPNYLIINPTELTTAFVVFIIIMMLILRRKGERT